MAEKKINIDSILNEINKKHGEGSIFLLGSEEHTDVESIPTGIYGVDVATGIGGVPLGKYVEIFAESGAGKSSFCLSVAAQAQKQGLLVAYLDGEHAVNLDFAEKLGVVKKDLLFSQPDNAEVGFDIVESLIDSNQVSLIIIDSVDALLTKRELEGELSDSDIGIKAKFMSKACRRLKAKTHNANCCLIFISQMRDNIGAMGHAEKTTTTGGKALKFYSDMRIRFKRVGQIKSGDDVVGHKVEGTVVKNKIAAPMKNFAYEVYYADYNTIYSELIDLGIEAGLINKGGAWLTYGEVKLQGKEKFRQLLMENSEVKEKLDLEVKGWLGLI